MGQVDFDCVFLVDDDEDDRFLVRQAFKKHSPAVTLQDLPNGEELLKALAQSIVLPKLVLLDLNMPYMNGLEALERIRKDDLYGSVPIVILTTSDNPSDKQRASALKANGFVTKPSTAHELEQIVQTISHQWLEA